MTCDNTRMSVAEAAARMGITPQALRMGLRHGRFPFGTAVKMERRWIYYISRERFDRWMRGEDMLAEGQEKIAAGTSMPNAAIEGVSTAFLFYQTRPPKSREGNE